MKVKFIVIGLGVCTATSVDEREIYCIVGCGGRKTVFSEKLIPSQKILNTLVKKCDLYRNSKATSSEFIEEI